MSSKRRNDGALTAGDSNASKKPKVNGSITSFFGAPKPAPAPSSSSAPTAAAAASSAPGGTAFDKEKWAAGLTPEQRQLLSLEIETMDPSWLAVLKDEITTPQFIELKKFLDREAGAGKKIFPPREDIYSWTRHTPFQNVKCVILGQDPYHNVNQAHGLAFSVRPPTPAPPSLRNMYKALQRDYPDGKPHAFQPPPKNGGLLTAWADRGVLLLNTCLTVRAHEANSHANRGWERLTQRAIDLVAQRRHRGGGVVFMAWGTPAGKRVQKVDRKKHLVLQSVHPSPLSASRGFFDCGHFRKANEWLVGRYGEAEEIDWNLGSAAAKPVATATAAGAGAGASKPVPAAVVKAKAKAKTEEEEYDDDDDDEDALAAAAAAAEAEAEAEDAAAVEKAKAKAKAKADEQKDVPPPVIAVDEVKDDDKKGGEEKSELLEKEGENSAAAEAEAETEAETENENEPKSEAKVEVVDDNDEAKTKAAEDELK